ncbi:hypothetical protein JTB14_024643 [Gonioctena quinquepunctata]|nr:hypothetical protein JTB14_024643 [Gonioctena quinquepunctata]
MVGAARRPRGYICVDKSIPNIGDWVECAFRDTDYWLTGHGCFKTYTHRIGKSEDEVCMYCNERYFPEHTVFSCVRWTTENMEVDRKVEIILNAGNLIVTLIENGENWKTV